MTKYFMSGTRWEQWERMMMDPSRTAHDDEDHEESEQEKTETTQQNHAVKK